MPQQRRTKAKSFFISQRLVSLPALLKKRTMTRRVQAIKAELAARTLHVVDGDVIIITSLDKKPFCCQDELSIMTRPGLCRVARDLNKKLPQALQIESAEQMSCSVLRARIEEMMGFRHFRPHLKSSKIDPYQPIHLNRFADRLSTGKRSPTSSFSSVSSASSAPYGLSVVAEMDEEFSDTMRPVSSICNVSKR